MSTTLPQPAEAAAARIGAGQEPSAWQTVMRGLRLAPELRRGLALTLLLALVATAGRTVVPVAVQQILDRGINAGTPDLATVRVAVLVAFVVVVLTAVAGWRMNVRLFRASETALSSLRVTAFRHIHDLSVLTQDAERRGSLVSRVTGDVDTISTFLQSGGLLLIILGGQLVVATAVMAYYSWQLALLVWLTFLPFFLFLRYNRRRAAEAYGLVRRKVGGMLAAVSEAVLGAAVIRAYGAQDRSSQRVDAAVGEHYDSAVRAQRTVALASGAAELASGLATAAVVVVGVLLGVDGDLTAGQLLAVLFLVPAFVGPIQMGTETLNEGQNAVAGWRRVLAVLDTSPDVADPGAGGVDLPDGPLEVRAEAVTFAYPGGAAVLHGVDVTIEPGSRIAVVGETGSGKSTFAKLLVRLVDPTEGAVRLGGTDLRSVRFSSLRRRVVLVLQEGFLFDASLRDNLRFASPDTEDEALVAAFARLGLSDWYERLPAGLDTALGQRGESLSVGERQLVALVRAALVDPEILVLDEATSSVDPVTEVRLSRALEGLARGRTSITIAHRLSTAEAADDVLVFDAGRLVERGPHRVLLAQGGAYTRLHAAWMAQART